MIRTISLSISFYFKLFRCREITLDISSMVPEELRKILKAFSKNKSIVQNLTKLYTNENLMPIRYPNILAEKYGLTNLRIQDIENNKYLVFFRE